MLDQLRRAKQLHDQAQQALMSREEAKQLAKQYQENPNSVCRFCGGWHGAACLRVKRIVYKGNDVTEVEFWQEWDQSGTIYPEQALDLAMGDETR